MNLASLATLIAFAAYLVYSGIQPSISDTYRTGNKAIFHLFFFVVSGLIWLQGYYTSDPLDFLYMGAGLFLFCVSLYASFWKKEEKTGHVIFTYASIALGLAGTVMQLWPVHHFYSFVPVVLFVAGAVPLFKVKNTTYWQEAWAVVCIFTPII